MPKRIVMPDEAEVVRHTHAAGVSSVSLFNLHISQGVKRCP